MKAMRKLLVGLFVLFLMITAISCDDKGNKVPEEVTVSTWDGTSVDTSWYSDDTKEYTLTEASQLAGLAKLVSDGTADFSGVTIHLDNNINLNDKQWTPIGLYVTEKDEDVKKPFSGTFDGQNHVITGLKIDCDNDVSSYRALFGYVNGTIKNFTLKGEVNASDSAAVVAALDKGGLIENVTSYVNVTSKRASGQAKLGGIVLTVKNKQTTGKGYTIKGCKNYGRITSSSSDSASIGGILGWTDDESGELLIEDCENHGEIKATGTQVAGGIVGACRKITIKNCTNSGLVSSASKAAGGIVGCNDTTTVELVSCKNTGSVTGGKDMTGGVAGIMSGSLKDCTTTGSTVVLVGNLGNGSDDNTISYSTGTEISLPSVIYNSITLENVESASTLSLHYKGKGKHDLTVTLKNSSVAGMVVTMEQNEGESRLYLIKEGTSSLGSLKFEGSFDRQNVNTHGELYIFANEVIEQKNITNELIFKNREESSTDKDFGNASIYYVATGTSSSHTDSKETKIESVMEYKSGEWSKKSTT